jgi:FixJ family two-component response regulator
MSLRLGAVGLLRKPFEAGALLQAIHSAMATAEAGPRPLRWQHESG